MIIKKVMPKIPVAKKRVAAYCRVSTFRNEQDESFETQQKYYEELIQSHPDWELVKVYADRHSGPGRRAADVLGRIKGAYPHCRGRRSQEDGYYHLQEYFPVFSEHGGLPAVCQMV